LFFHRQEEEAQAVGGSVRHHGGQAAGQYIDDSLTPWKDIKLTGKREETSPLTT